MPAKKRKKYESERQRDKRKHEAYKGDRGTFWADYEPRRDFGVYARELTSYTLNGKPVYQ